MSRKLKRNRQEKVRELLDKYVCVCYLYEEDKICENCRKLITKISEVEH